MTQHWDLLRSILKDMVISNRSDCMTVLQNMKLKYIETEVNLIDDIGRWQHYIASQVRSENIKIRIPIESMKASYLQTIMNSVPCGIMCSRKVKKQNETAIYFSLTFQLMKMLIYLLLFRFRQISLKIKKKHQMGWLIKKNNYCNKIQNQIKQAHQYNVKLKRGSHA